MLLILIIIFLLYLGIMWYIVKNRDNKLAIYFIKLLIVITLTKLLYIWYQYYTGNNFCSVIKKAWNCN